MFYLLILLVAASRFLPHPPNVACVGALGLFAGCYLQGRRAYLVPLAVMLGSDMVGHMAGIPGLGFYSPITMVMVYLGMVLAVPVGRWIRTSKLKIACYPIAAVGASTLFFLVSNLGHWLAGFYPMTGAGLLACYVNAIPFYGLTLTGDLAFTALLFGSWEFSRRFQMSQVRELHARAV